MNIKSEKTRGGRRIVIMLMLAAFSLALFSTPVSALSKDPKNSLTHPWGYNSDGGDEGGYGEVDVSRPPVIPQRLFLFIGYFNFTVIYVGNVETRSSVKKADISKIDYDSSSNDRRTTFTR